MSINNRLLLSLIDHIYAAAVDSSLWPVFLGGFTEAFRGQQSTFFSHDLSDLRANFHACAHIDEYFVKSYTDYYHKRNFFVERISHLELFPVR